MDSKFIPITLGVLLALFLIQGVSASVFYEPRIEGNRVAGANLSFSVKNSSGVTDPSLVYREMKVSGWKRCSLNLTTFACNLTLDQGVYDYYYNSSNYRFPENGSLHLALSQGNQTLEEIAENFTQKNPSSPNRCKPWDGNYSCRYENWQAGMIQAFYHAYRITENETYKDKLERLSTSEIDNVGAYASCDYGDNDFDCDTSSPLSSVSNVTASIRQGSLIKAMWNSYSLTQNSSIREIALNYTKGHAEDCDVWGGDFECNETKGQALMIQGYWKSYLMTGNSTYRSVALNLTDRLLNSSTLNSSNLNLTSAFWYSYELTKNKTYGQKAKNLTHSELDYCPNNECGAGRFSSSLTNKLEAFRVTRDFPYYRYSFENAFKEVNSSCNRTSFSCDAANLGSISTAYWKSYQYLLVENVSLFNPRPGNYLSAQETAVKVGMEGLVNWPKIYLKKVNETSWHESNISLKTQKAEIPSWVMAGQEPYEFYFNSTTQRFPESGSFHLALSRGNQTLEEIAKNFTQENPSSPNKCKPWDGNYSCRYENWQAGMIQAFYHAYRITENETYKDKLERLSLAGIDTNDPGFASYTSCDHADNDFDCNLESSMDVKDINASIRQGSLIKAMWNSYSLTQNSSIREIALNYTKGHAEDCDVWDGDFECNETKGQALMIQGYWSAYRLTANDTYRSMALNLTKEAINMGSAYSLARAFWISYSYTNNETFRSKAVNLTVNQLNSCIQGNCTPSDLSSTALSTLEAYETTANETYLNKSREKINSMTTSCNPWNSTFNCSDPSNQSAMSILYWTSSHFLPTSLNVSQKLELSKSEVSVGSSFKVYSTTYNYMNSTDLFNLSFKLQLPDGLSTAENETVGMNVISSQENKTVNWTVNTESSGDKVVEVSVETRNGWNSLQKKTIKVLSEDEDGGDDGGGGGGGAVISLQNKTITETYYFNYTKDEISKNLEESGDFRSKILQFSKNVSLSRTLAHRKCFKGLRRHELRDRSTLILNVTYICSPTLESVFIKDPLGKDIVNHSSKVEIVTEADTYVLKEDPVFMFEFSDVEENDNLVVKYLLDRRVSGALDFTDEPFLVLTYNKTMKEIPLKISLLHPTFNTTENESITAVFNVSTSVSTECTITNTLVNETIKTNKPRILEERLPLIMGENWINFSCTDVRGEHEKITFSVFHTNRTEAGQAQPRLINKNILYLLFLITIFLTPLLYKKRKYLKVLYLKYLFKKAKLYMRMDKFDKIIDLYPTLDDLYEELYEGKLGRKELEEELGELARSIKIYILLQMTEDALERGKGERAKKAMQTISGMVERFLKQSEDKSIKEKIRREYGILKEKL